MVEPKKSSTPADRLARVRDLMTTATHPTDPIFPIRDINARSAGEHVGPITHGINLVGLFKGQWSLADLIVHALDATGPAHLTISTWTAGGADLEHFYRLLTSEQILSLRWLVDFSFPSRQPGYCLRLVDLFGTDAVRVTANHAKFTIIRNDEWDLIITTTANLNKNARLEHFYIHDDKAIADWFAVLADELFAEAPNIDTPPGQAQATLTDLGGALRPSLTQGLTYD